MCQRKCLYTYICVYIKYIYVYISNIYVYISNTLNLYLTYTHIYTHVLIYTHIYEYMYIYFRVFCLTAHGPYRKGTLTLQLFVNRITSTRSRRLIGCFIFIGHVPQKSPTIGGSFVGNDSATQGTLLVFATLYL